MKKLVYGKEGVLSEGLHSGYRFIIVNGKFYPSVFVRVPEAHPAHGVSVDDLCDIRCHGGITFSGELLDQRGWWVGWEYNHPGDYRAGSHKGSVKRWTTEELYASCSFVIKQLIEIKKLRGFRDHGNNRL